MPRRACRVDGPHTEIRRGLEALGCAVADTSSMGEGYPDLTVGKRGRVVLLEVKDSSKPPSARRLTPAQEKFHARWRLEGVPLFVVHDLDEAVDAVFERQRSNGK